MRFFLIMYPDPARAYTGSGLPDAPAVAAMARFNRSLLDAGALVALDGLAGPAEGARVRYAGGLPTVVAGPFHESREVVGGYWIIRAASLDEAVDWARRIPAAEGDMVEVRRIFEMSDFPEDVREAARL